MKGYPLTLEGNVLITRAAVGSLDGTTSIVRLLVDTGASTTMLPMQLLRKVGSQPDNPQRNMNIITGNGIRSIPITTVLWFGCCGQQVEAFEVGGLDFASIAAFDGVLGMDFLRMFGATIDIKAAKIYI
jgi:predicted aspartyl protease